MSGARSALTAAALTGASAALYAWRESKRVQPTETVLRVPGLPPGLQGLRILHVADTHFPASGESLPRFLAAARRQRYDLVVGTGDFVDSAAAWDVALRAFRSLEPGLGVFAVIGGHDRYARMHAMEALPRLAGRRQARWVDPRPFIDGLRARGVHVLMNAQVTAEIGGELVRFVGIDDAYHGLDRLEAALPAGGLAAGGLGAPGFPMLLSHSPDGALNPRARGFPIAFSGHTHGGQIRIPGYGAPVRHARAVGRRNASGVVRVGETQVVISRGFGTTTLPLRLACPPELGVVVLEALPGSAS